LVIKLIDELANLGRDFNRVRGGIFSLLELSFADMYQHGSWSAVEPDCDLGGQHQPSISQRRRDLNNPPNVSGSWS
jgi:hypothetical protein